MQNSITKTYLTNLLPPIVMFFIIFGSWEIMVNQLEIERWILPGPIAIFNSMIVSFSDFLPHILVTIQTISIGFIIAIPLGIFLAALLSNFQYLDFSVSPFVILLVTTPLISLVPLLMMWFGYGLSVKVIAVIIQAFPIIMLNSATGFINVDNLRLELMKSLASTRSQTFFRAVFPSALSEVFTGIKLGGIFGTIAAVTAEFVGGNTGLGSQIIKYTQYIKTEEAFACILFVAIIGTVLYGLISLMEKLIIRWEI
ncbi:ABC transporter permease [Virgibacillus sp. W0430]|uniref:ABC transporter permease n=1 Tax=Virgibacillus sp. W0430 TaxID=3391580 RepID=UPI003F46F636